MKKKIVSFVLCTVMAAAMVGCGSGGGDSKSTAASAGEPSSASSSADSAPADDGDTDSGDMLTVGFSQVGAESDWRTANSASMKETFTEANGYNLIFDDAQQKQENQITAIRNFIQQEVDYIVLAPVTETGWDTVLKEAQDADIPVIIVDRMVDVSDDSLYTAWVGSNFRAEGDKAVTWLDEYYKSKGMENEEINIVNIQGTIGASAQIGRTEGLEAGIEAHSNWKMAAQQTGEFTQAKGQEVMESVLKQHDDIDVVYCENDNEAFGAIDAIEAAGKTVGVDGDILVVSFDSTNAGLTDTMSGKITLNVECNPLHGPRVQEIIEKLEAGETPDKQAFVDEEVFAATDVVKSLTTDAGSFDVTVVTQDVLDNRAY